MQPKEGRPARGKLGGEQFKLLATARLIRKAFDSLIYSSALGPSIYLSKQAFPEGEAPTNITIAIDWQTPEKENTDAKTN